MGAITGGLVVLRVGVLAVAPYVVAAGRPTERPAGEDAAGIERLRDRAGLGGDEVAGDGDGGPTGALVAVAGVGLLLGLWGARRGVRAADEHAADRVGADALGRYAAVHDVEPSRRPVPNPLAVGVTLGDRIDRPRGYGDG